MVDFKDKKWFILYSILIVLFDQILKYIVEVLNLNIVLSSFFSLVYIKNQGAAFGILHGFQWLFILIALIVFGIMIYYYKKINNNKILLLVSWSLIIGGLLGNLIDRIFRGYVVDYISFSFWPAFNVADSCLVVGVILLLYVFWRIDSI